MLVKRELLERGVPEFVSLTFVSMVGGLYPHHTNNSNEEKLKIKETEKSKEKRILTAQAALPFP